MGSEEFKEEESSHTNFSGDVGVRNEERRNKKLAEKAKVDKAAKKAERREYIARRKSKGLKYSEHSSDTEVGEDQKELEESELDEDENAMVDEFLNAKPEDQEKERLPKRGEKGWQNPHTATAPKRAYIPPEEREWQNSEEKELYDIFDKPRPDEKVI